MGASEHADLVRGHEAESGKGLVLTERGMVLENGRDPDDGVRPCHEEDEHPQEPGGT